MTTEVEKLIEIDGELENHGTSLTSVKDELTAQGVTLDEIKAEQLDQGTVLDDLKTEQLDQGTIIDDLKTELLDQGTILDDFQEAFTGYNAIIESDHAYIHQQLAYTSIIDCGSISSAYHIAFKTPTVASGKFVHWRPIGLETSADYVKCELREGDTYTGGSAVTPINRNRLSNGSSSMQAFAKGVTATPTGTLVQLVGIGSAGNPAARSGGGSFASQELILKQNTVYILTLTPAGATTVTIELFWYEESSGV